MYNETKIWCRDIIFKKSKHVGNTSKGDISKGNNFFIKGELDQNHTIGENGHNARIKGLVRMKIIRILTS